MNYLPYIVGGYVLGRVTRDHGQRGRRAWAGPKSFFPAIQFPLFHATRGPSVTNIVMRNQGLVATSGFSRFGGQQGISMSRDLNSLLTRGGVHGNYILVFDYDELKRHYKIAPYQAKGGEDEYEERVMTDKIPASRIKGIIYRHDPMSYEMREMATHVSYPLVYRAKDGRWTQW